MICSFPNIWEHFRVDIVENENIKSLEDIQHYLECLEDEQLEVERLKAKQGRTSKGSTNRDCQC